MKGHTYACKQSFAGSLVEKNIRFYLFSANVQITEVVAKGEREGENLWSRVASCLLGCLLTFKNYQKYKEGREYINVILFYLVGFLLGRRTPCLWKCLLAYVIERAADSSVVTPQELVFPRTICLEGIW